MAPDREALIGATNRFVAFFRELHDVFVEREDLLKQIALALLSRQHVLMTGPPGTAKSKLAHAVLGRIVCEASQRPSLFARQFTESTVQTDLVGPLDFKTLMETGRTEHFTDEGMLGSVHAFLDEVFDGRDMLLRSALNLLHERELKQGSKISRGQIECALMTTNRYLVEVLESERLVAFVDRIAFLCFVPKGFAGPDALTQVLRQQVAGRTTAPLHARLTIQDLDLLQDAVKDVVVGEPLCALVAKLAGAFDAALASARRADPSFAPSRYVSTRGVVRLAELLRSICFYDWAFNDRDRPLEARVRDLADLRLGLTVCGPGLGEAARLLETETDPRERRQLGLVRAEREIFERCLMEMPVLDPPPPPFAALAPALASASTPEVLETKSPAELLALAREVASCGPSGQDRLAAILQKLVDRALVLGLRAGGPESRDQIAVLAELAQLADDIEAASAEHREAARWLRGKALAWLAQVADLGPSPFPAGSQHLHAASGALEAMQAIVDAQVGRVERLASLRAGLRLAGVHEQDAGPHDIDWKGAVDKVAGRLWPDLAAGFAAQANRQARTTPGTNLSNRIQSIEPTLAIVRQAANRLTALGADGTAFFARVVAGPVGPIVRQCLLEREPEPRSLIASALIKDLAVLSEAGLTPLLPASDLSRWVAQALLRASHKPPSVGADPTPGYSQYRAFRRTMPPASLAFTLVEVLGTLPSVRERGRDLDGVARGVTELVRTFPETLRADLASSDLAYLEAPVAFLERWWREIEADLPQAPRAARERLMTSGFFAITHEECALARFELEGRLMSMVVGDIDITPLLARARALADESTALVERLSTSGIEGASGPA